MKRVLTGPSGSGKTYRILDEFRAAIKARCNDVRLVVPTATLARHLRHEIAREGLVFSPRSIVTLSGFTRELSGDVSVVDNATLALVAELAVREVNAPEFARVSRMPGFHTALVNTIGELDAAGCSAEQFARVKLQAPLAPPLLAVWRRMERELTRRGFFTRSQMLRRAALAARDSRIGVIWFDGFAGFSRPELELIEAAAVRADVTVALPTLATAIQALADLRAAGFEFEELTPVPDADSDIPFQAAWFQAENAEREADEIARRILLYNQGGREFRDIAVILRSAENIAALLQTTFDRYGIPSRFYFSQPLSVQPVAGFVSKLMEALLSDWDLEAILAALRLMPGLAPGTALDQWDIAIRECIPGAGLEILSQLGIPIAQRLAEFDPWRSITWTAQRWAEAIAGIPSRFHPARPANLTVWKEVAIQRTEAAATHAWFEALDIAARWFPADRAIGVAEFWQVASAVIRLTPVSVADLRRNVVHVMSVFEARQWDPAVMFIPNLTEKEFPRYHSQNPFLPDSAVRQLQAEGIRLRDSRDHDAEEACLFDAIAQRPLSRDGKRREVCLSYPRRNAHGDENLRSCFVDRLRATESRALLSRPLLAVPPVPVRLPAPIRTAELISQIAARTTRFSPSSLEMYARCPFQFFAGRTLALQSLPDTPEERLSFLVQGNIVHDVLKEWTTSRGPLKPHFDAIYTDVCEREHIQATWRTEVLRQRMLDDLERFCAGFQTYGQGQCLSEQQFDFEILPGVQLRGRIDRVDGSAGRGEGAVIVDYKYSNNIKQNVDDATKLQGVLYTIAAERALGLKPRATMFVAVKGEQKSVGWGELPGFELRPITAEWLQSGLATVGRMTAEIRAGKVNANPSDPRHCVYCEFRDACRYEVTEAVVGA